MATLAIGPTPPGASDDARSIDVVVHADRPVGSSGDWLRIESTESADVRLTLTASSARELIRALGIVLDEISR